MTKVKPKKAKSKKPASKAAKKSIREDVWATIREFAKENKSMLKTLKQTQKIVGDLGNRFGDFSEANLVPDLKEKFKKYGFNFNKLNQRTEIDDDEHDIHTEIDAFLENGAEAILVEVKAALKKTDVDDHIKRMKKMRRYSDFKNDTRKFYGAIAATVVDQDARIYALKQGFFLIVPSGESVKIIPPSAAAKSW